MTQKPEKEPKNPVHQNAILVETIKKETRTQKLYTNYSVNPFHKIHAIAPKPNSLHDVDGEEDEHFVSIMKRAQQEPTRKYLNPQTTNQEYGWITQPLIDKDVSDKRLHHPTKMSEMTKFMETAWLIKEAQANAATQ